MVGEGTETAEPTLSTGVVGYTTFDIVGGKWYLIGINFQSIGKEATDKKVKLNDFIKGDFVGTTSIGTAPRLQIWDTINTKYTDYYFFSSSAGAPANKKYNYWAPDSNSLQDYTRGQNTELDLGQGAWFCSQTDCTITIAGQVVPADATTVEIKAGLWNLISNPFPTELKINQSVNWLDQVNAGNMTGTTSIGTAPRMQVWDPINMKYTDYYFFSSSAGAPANKKYNYWAPDSNSLQDYTRGQSAVVPVGQGFWFNHTGKDMTITITR